MTDVTREHLTTWRDAIFAAFDRKPAPDHDPGPLPETDTGLTPDSVPFPVLVAAFKAFFEAAKTDDRAEALGAAVEAFLPIHKAHVRQEVAAEARAAAEPFMASPDGAVQAATLRWFADRILAETT